MMEAQKNMTGEDSFKLIQQMINTAKNDMEDSSFYFLLWGWLVFIASIGNFILIKMSYEYNWILWAVLMPLGGLITTLYSRRQNKMQRVKTYIDELMKFVWIAFVVSLFIVLFFMSRLQLSTYPLIMLIYGVWLFVSGGALKFRPLILGGIINWLLAIVSFFLVFNGQLITLALAVLTGFIIPGHMLKKKNSQPVR
jgi:hypothetical protein